MSSAVAVTHPVLGEFILHCEGEVPLLFTENETNHERLFPGQQNESPYVKDGINDYVVQGNPERRESRLSRAPKWQLTTESMIGAGQTVRRFACGSPRIRPTQKTNPFGQAI